jgi:phosphopentomutase
MGMTPMSKRAFVIVIDALGVGALPDASVYNDAPGANTLGNIDKNVEKLSLPNLERLGIGHITPLQHVKAVDAPKGYYGKLSEYSQGKDTTTGHWEMMGLYLEKPFRVYPEGFPPDLIQTFIERSGCKGILGNVPASGTEILDRLGEAHLETGYPIIYTSADSVFQIATHVERVPLATLYHWCEVARELLQGEHEVSRVIARPFMGVPGKFERLGGDRRDYAVPPPAGSCLDAVKQAGGVVLAIGKIEDIFCQVGVTHAIHTNGNTHGLEITRQSFDGTLDVAPLSIENKALDAYDSQKQFVFVNLVDTDMKYGHRRDVQGYARALEEIDVAIGQYLELMGPDDIMMITGDHGCDPTAPGSDHTREYAPIIMYSSSLPGGALGVRKSFADIGKTVLEWLQIDAPLVPGVSMLHGSAQPKTFA